MSELRNNHMKKVLLRFREPRKHGSMFVYRHIDVLRVVAIAKAIADEPRVVDAGCGNCDFLDKLRVYLPNAIGIDNKPKFTDKPYVLQRDIRRLRKRRYDLAFIGWMELGVDFRKAITRIAPVNIMVWERGGACGIEGECDFDEFGLVKIASWRTPAWMDINIRLMVDRMRHTLAIDNFAVGSIWDVWAEPEIAFNVQVKFMHYLNHEDGQTIEPYDFEEHIDKAGYRIGLPIDDWFGGKFWLWEVQFEKPVL